MSIRMIVTDLDGTLLRRDKSLSVYTRSVLARCTQRGILVVFATARPARATPRLGLDALPSYVIANNGATIEQAGRCIRNISISQDTKRGLIARLVHAESVDGISVEVGDRLYTNDREHASWSTIGDWNAVFTDFHDGFAEDVCKISADCSDTQLLRDILREYPEVYILPNHGETWHQITHRSASKWRAIAHLCDVTGIAAEDILAFGDDYNDVEMLRECGAGIAVENAVDEAKAIAGGICDANEVDGVAKYIEKYVI